MIARLIAWGLVLSLGVVVYQYGSAFKNPWSSVSGAAVGSPVLSMLPAASDGCSKNCKK